ncbi:ABC-F family ATP-binding cassette domain-containing protein [Haliangium ochraceum]|uniref:Probable ATP-binding protein YbiT n=1 Tax=Haliangium ochraceum (strain DSM 14365 / JCM 11303 / SMP-2) TaxID=502025 RepID=D0LL36_HALO1|nr:ABC-F family ATP-binding cassette domain-containing protein [Haliangium ochraceum]ACY18532.1 ABC transporter related protein [Haliangium ochraceum DSM 14365]
MVLEDVALLFGSRVIFENLGMRLDESDRIGLVGPNGSGKTSLLRIMAGQQEIDRGNLTHARGVRVGYLPQELAVAGGTGLLDFIISSVPGRTQVEEELAEAEAEIESVSASSDADTDQLMALAERVAELHERLDHFERFFSEHEAMRILAGLGFETSDHGRDLAEFSGGWQMRAVLAGLLFQRPEVLLLDEPTNHLDMPSVAWFSAFLKRYPRCFVLISHDREFLNEQINRVVSLEPEGVRSYPGDLDNYVKQRAEEEIILENKAKNIEREREHLERFIERFRAKASKATLVQSRVKALEKLEDVTLYQKRKVMHITFPPTSRTVGEVMRVDKVRKAYGDHVVFPGVNLSVRRGEKIGIIGVNGAGKTTLLKMMAGELGVDAGAMHIGNGVKVGYYAQHHADTLDVSATVYEAVQRANPDAEVGRVRAILGAFLFSGDDVDKQVSVLSGGERARVALARLLVDPGNLLLMDEPTNHLDLQSSESLAESLTKFDGSLVFVSHNRSLIRTVATKIWNVEAGRVEVYAGSLDEYLYSSQLRRDGGEVPAATGGAAAARRAPGGSGGARESEAKAAPPAAPEKAQGKGSREEEKARKRRAAELRKKRAQVVGPLEKKVASLEKRITELEEVQSERSAKLSDPAVYEDSGKRDTLLNAFQDDQTKLDELTGRWEVAQAQLDEALSSFDAEVGE